MKTDLESNSPKRRMADVIALNLKIAEISRNVAKESLVTRNRTIEVNRQNAVNASQEKTAAHARTGTNHKKAEMKKAGISVIEVTEIVQDRNAVRLQR